MENYSKLTDEIVTTTYEDLIHDRLPFLQIFTQMFQDANIADKIAWLELFSTTKFRRLKLIRFSLLNFS